MRAIQKSNKGPNIMLCTAIIISHIAHNTGIISYLADLCQILDEQLGVRQPTGGETVVHVSSSEISHAEELASEKAMLNRNSN